MKNDARRLVPERKREKEREREREENRSHQSSPKHSREFTTLSPPSRSIDSIHFLGRVSRDRFELPEIEKKKKKKKGKKGKKRDEKRERWKAFGKFFHDFDRFFFLIVSRLLSRVKRLENCIIGWKGCEEG